MDAGNSRYAACSVFRWDGDPGHCRACNGDLPHRRRTWCSAWCSEHYSRNHFWTQARPARIVLDDFTCQRCGVRSEPRDSSWEFYARPGWEREGLGHDDARQLFAGPVLQVHHVFPMAWQQGIRNGHETGGCHHHQSLLVTVCVECHREIEKRWRFMHRWARFFQMNPQLDVQEVLH